MQFNYNVPSQNVWGQQVPRHRTFISYYHKEDQNQKASLVSLYGGEHFIDKSVGEGDIDTTLSTDTIRAKIRDDFIADATVTVVIVGNGTWRRKHVDWEIGSALRDTRNNSRTGLVGVLSPYYNVGTKFTYSDLKLTEDQVLYNPYNIPPRLWDNVKCGFAKMYSWNYFANSFNTAKIIDAAFSSRYDIKPDNSRTSFSNNRPDHMVSWG